MRGQERRLTSSKITELMEYWSDRTFPMMGTMVIITIPTIPTTIPIATVRASLMCLVVMQLLCQQGLQFLLFSSLPIRLLPTRHQIQQDLQQNLLHYQRRHLMTTRRRMTTAMEMKKMVRTKGLLVSLVMPLSITGPSLRIFLQTYGTILRKTDESSDTRLS